MIRYYLKFADEVAARAVLHAYLAEDGDWLTASHEHALDPVGTIYLPTGITHVDVEGVEYQEVEPLSGWHVNLMLPDELPDELLPYAVTPENPARVFG